MSQSIPFIPGLTLGQIVKSKEVEQLIERSKLQKDVDLAYEALENSKIALTKTQLLKIELNNNITDNTNIKGSTGSSLEKDIDKLIADLRNSTDTNLSNYIKAKISYNKQLANLGKAEQKDPKNTGIINFEYKSPVDFNKSKLGVFPFNYDTIDANVQYVDFENSTQDSTSKLNELETAAGFKNSGFFSGDTIKATYGKERQSSTLKNLTNIKGTLVISAKATHKNVSMFSPLIIDPEQAIRTWNYMYPNFKIDPYDTNSLTKFLAQKKAINMSSKTEECIKVLSGVTYGSSFVAYIHTLNSNSRETSQKIKGIEESLNLAFKEGAWFAEKEGSFGIDDDFSKSIRKSLDTISLESFFDIIVNGYIPTIESQEVITALKGFQDFDGKKNIELLANMQNSIDTKTEGLSNSLDDSAKAAIDGQKILNMKKQEIQSAMLAVGELDQKKNDIINTNTVLTTFTNYVTQCHNASENDKVMGVPISFYLDTITAEQIVIEWSKKYKPNFYEKIMGINNSNNNTNTRNEENSNSENNETENDEANTDTGDTEN